MEKTTLLHPSRVSLSTKLSIPLEVENKISYICKKIPDKEWSGILFYTTSGSIEDKNFKIICKDVLLLDIGESAYTSFETSPEIAAYIAENIELIDCYMGLIHSHNKMKVFFSSTDLYTLHSEGEDMKHFVSVVVNNEGDCTAALTRKTTYSILSTINYTYPSFNKVIEKKGEQEETIRTIIEYDLLEIEREEDTNLNYLGDRIKELSDIKKVSSNNVLYTPDTLVNRMNNPIKFTNYADKQEEVYNDYSNTMFNKYSEYSRPAIKQDIVLQPSFKDDIEEVDTLEDNIGIEELDNKYKNVIIPTEVLNSTILQILTSSILIPHSSKVDIPKLVDNLENLYCKRFNDFSDIETWLSSLIEYIVYEDSDNHLSPLGIEREAFVYHLLIEFSKLKRNKIINIIINELISYF